jgi:hypothetical protein
MWGWHNRPVVAAVPSELSRTPLRMMIIKMPRFETLSDYYLDEDDLYRKLKCSG